jgi:hypothetical protein
MSAISIYSKNFIYKEIKMKNLFKGKTISLITSGLILSSSMAFGADSIDSAFKEGKASGSINLYTVSQDNKAGNADSAFSSGDIEVSYETGIFNGFSGKVSFIGAHVFDEKNTGDADDIASKSLLSEANLKYSMEGASVTVGRQAVDLEWMGDYHEAVVAAITAVPDTTIVLGYTDKMAVAGVDEVSENFSKVNGTDGAYVLDIKYAGIEGVELNPYFYTAPDAFDFYGLKATYSSDMFGGTAHYASSDVDKAWGTTNSKEDGSIGHVELNTTLAGISAALGYIKTDKNGGVGAMDSLGDNISPFEDGNQVYEADAKTTYGSLGYSVVGIDLGALYGQTTYGTADDKEKELNLTVGHSFTDSLSASLLYADIKAESSSDDYNKVLATVSYTF